jgi:hypothetical protein
MGIHRGSNIIRSGLEFAYDTGYSSTFDNSSNYLHNKGEPTTNLNVDTYHSTRSDGDTITSATWGGDSGEAEFRTNTSPDGGGLMYISKNTSSPAGSGGVYNDFPATRYTLTNGVTYTRSWWCKSNINQTLSGHICSCNRDSDNTYIIGSNISLTTEWQKFSSTFTYTGPTSTDWQFRHINYNASEVYIANVQLEAKEHATPFTPGIRSSTASLLDLTRQSTIDLANVSFDSNAHMTFDGTDDKGEVSNFPAIWNGSVSLEAVASWDDDSRSIIFGNYNCNNNDINFEKLTGGTLRFYWGRGARDVTTTGNPRVTTSGDYHHVVFVRDTSANNFRFYVDGTLVTTVSNAGSNITSTGSTFRIGGDTRNGTTIHNGNIPIIRVYSKALTTEEVAQNFSAYRDRFNM